MKITITRLDTTPDHFMGWLRESTRDLYRESFLIHPKDSELLAKLGGRKPPGGLIFLRRPPELAIDPDWDPDKGFNMIKDSLRKLYGLPPEPEPSPMPEPKWFSLQAAYLLWPGSWTQDEVRDQCQIAALEWERMYFDYRKDRFQRSDDYPWVSATHDLGDAITFRQVRTSDTFMEVAIECTYRTVASYVEKFASAVIDRWPGGKIVDKKQPLLRDLNAAIKKCELGLREVVDATIDGNCSLIPTQVLQKVDERVSGAAKKNPAFAADRYQTLNGELEFFDLRELQGTITSKSLWGRFEPRFRNKDTLIAKFNQLAELRNSISHIRAVDEITRKEGEAAILWFQQMLNK